MRAHLASPIAKNWYDDPSSLHPADMRCSQSLRRKKLLIFIELYDGSNPGYEILIQNNTSLMSLFFNFRALVE